MSDSTTASVTFTGRVKWFNVKSGFGFITVTDGDRSGEDVFVHHSSIDVDKEQFKYLVQGEYVSFNLEETPEDSEHEYACSHVRGVSGGQLMCETRNTIRQERMQRERENGGSEHRQHTVRGSGGRGRGRGRGRRMVRGRGRSNQGTNQGREEWVLMRRRV